MIEPEIDVFYRNSGCGEKSARRRCKLVHALPGWCLGAGDRCLMEVNLSYLNAYYYINKAIQNMPKCTTNNRIEQFPLTSLTFPPLAHSWPPYPPIALAYKHCAVMNVQCSCVLSRIFDSQSSVLSCERMSADIRCTVAVILTI